MKHIDPIKMSESVRLLFETGELYHLSPERLASAIGVSFMSVCRWFRGTKPLPAHEALILDAVRKIDAAQVREAKIRKIWMDANVGKAGGGRTAIWVADKEKK